MAQTYFWYAERWQWTPAQVDDLPWLMQERLMAVAMVHDEAERDRRKSGG